VAFAKFVFQADRYKRNALLNLLKAFPLIPHQDIKRVLNAKGGELNPKTKMAYVHGRQIFLGPNIPKWEKYTKCPQATPNCHTLCRMAIKYYK
jgi:hypothetical protein